MAEKTIVVTDAECRPGTSGGQGTDFILDSYGQPITWPATFLPISVHVDQSFDEYEFATIMNGIEHWNEQLGFQVFIGNKSFVTEPIFLFGQITITKQPLQKICQRQTLGQATRSYAPSATHNREVIVSSHIEIHTEHVQDSRYFRTAVHELGHALGLQHDEDQNSVMFPSIMLGSWHIEEIDLFILRMFLKEDY